MQGLPNSWLLTFQVAGFAFALMQTSTVTAAMNQDRCVSLISLADLVDNVTACKLSVEKMTCYQKVMKRQVSAIYPDKNILGVYFLN